MPVRDLSGLERRQEGGRAAGGVEARERLRQSREASSREDAAAGEVDRGGLRPERGVALEVGGTDRTVPLLHEVEQGAGDRAPVDGRRALVAQQLECGDEPGLPQQIAFGDQLTAGRVERAAFAHRHDRREHRETRDVCRGHRDALAREP